jgi:hypothetical protein
VKVAALASSSSSTTADRSPRSPSVVSSRTVTVVESASSLVVRWSSLVLLSRRLHTTLDNILAVDSFLALVQALQALLDLPTQLNWLTPATVAQWPACTTTVSYITCPVGGRGSTLRLSIMKFYYKNAADILTVWWLGNIIAGWTTYGTDLNFPGSSWAWRVPTLIQCVIPAIVMSIVLFFPGKHG